MLGYSMGTQCTFAQTSAQCAVAFRGAGSCSLRTLQNPRLVLMLYCESLKANLHMVSVAPDNGTINADNWIAYQHQWGTASSCQGMCPSVPQLGYITVWPSLYIQKYNQSLKVQNKLSQLKAVRFHQIDKLTNRQIAWLTPFVYGICTVSIL